MQEKADWREFEKLISRIEKMLAPTGAQVLSPDRIRDKVTGKLREVDASVRHSIGSVPILITIECRDRKHKQDVQWLEQVKSKRDSIGAAQTIVVSKSGFTDEALAYAKAHGLIIRAVNEVDDALVVQCLGGVQVDYHRVGWKDITTNLGFYPEPTDVLSGRIALERAAEENLLTNKPFALDAENQPTTIEELFRECYELEDDRIRSLVQEKGEVRLMLEANVERGTVRSQTELGERSICKIIFHATFFQATTPLPALTAINYVDEQGGKIMSFSQTHDPITGFGVSIQFDWDSDGKSLQKG